MSIEAKIALVPDEEKGKFKGFVLILNINGIPLTIGGKDEPIEVVTCTEEQLMRGFLAHPQELVQTISQNSSYMEEVQKFLENNGFEVLEDNTETLLE